MTICANKKVAVNARTVSKALEEMVDKEVEINGLLMYEKEEQDVVKQVTTFIGKDGQAYSTISPYVRDCANGLLEAFTEDEILEGIKIKVIKSVSAKNKREFYQFILV